MSQIQIELKKENYEKLDELSLKTGKSSDELVNEAIENLVLPVDLDERQKFLAWREAAQRVAGIWKDRDDLPDFEELRKSWDRGYADRKE